MQMELINHLGIMNNDRIPKQIYSMNQKEDLVKPEQV
jgi:hypothetical protein